jgi:hypothetical protein
LEKLEANFNTSKVREMQGDKNQLYFRVGFAYRGGIMKRSEAHTKMGFQTEPEGEVYFGEPKKEEKPKDGKTDEVYKSEN